jgi:peptide/nickel transport system substrate-binding protein
MYKRAVSRVAIIAVVVIVIILVVVGAYLAISPKSTTSTSSSSSSSSVSSVSSSSSVVSSLSSSSSFSSSSSVGNSTHTLIIGGSFDPLTLNPIYDTSNLPMLMPLIFDGLTTVANDFTVHPLLATSWTISPNASIYTFTVRQGVEFTDGYPLTAQDVAFTYTLFANPVVASEVGGQFTNLTVSAPDNATVVFKFPTPRPDFITDTWYGIVPKHLLGNVAPVDLRNSTFGSMPVGSGPWKVVSYTPNSEVSLTANTNYWRGVPKITNIIYRIVTDTSALLTDVESHQIDLLNTAAFAGGISAQNVQQLGGNNSYQYVTQVPGTTQILYMGPLNDTPWNNLLVRQAVLHAVNRTAIIEKVLGAGGGVISNDRFTTGWAINPNIPGYAYNTTLSEQLLTEAGYPPQANGTRFSTTIYSTTGARVVWTQLIANMLGQVGINVKVDVVGDFGTYYSLLSNQGPTANHNGLWTIFNQIDPDPATTAQELTPSNNYAGGVNVANVNNATLTHLLQEGVSTANQTLRQQYYYQAGLLESQMAVDWPLWITIGFNVVSCHVKNFTSDGALGMDDVALFNANWSPTC